MNGQAGQPCAVGTVDLTLRPAVEDFLFHEARLIDALALDRWVGLFDDDGEYMLPMGERGDDDPLRIGLVRDDVGHLQERVWRILGGRSFVQSPAARTLHQIGNVAARRIDDEMVEVESVQLILALHHGQQRLFGTDCVHRLRRHDDDFRIVAKTVYLLNRDEPLGDLTFIL